MIFWFFFSLRIFSGQAYFLCESCHKNTNRDQNSSIPLDLLSKDFMIFPAGIAPGNSPLISSPIPTSGQRFGSRFLFPQPLPPFFGVAEYEIFKY